MRSFRVGYADEVILKRALAQRLLHKGAHDHELGHRLCRPAGLGDDGEHGLSGVYMLQQAPNASGSTLSMKNILGRLPRSVRLSKLWYGCR